MTTEALFARELLRWNEKDNRRQMPWKGERDPYKIWLSEIILQQTRVEQGLKYYQNFISAFPDVHRLAAAPEAQVFKLWEGLGYYSRCRNLIATARHVAFDLGGVFPRSYEVLLALKGVGPYTAAAIASFAYGLPHAVLDGNVYRVLSRILLMEVPSDGPEGKKAFAAAAGQALPEKAAAAYNQAIMDFGATICKPLPHCAACFFQKHCRAYAAGRQLELPVKTKKTAVRERWIHYIVALHEESVLIRQRHSKDIWEGLHEFIPVETGAPCTEKDIFTILQTEYGIRRYHLVESHGPQRQKLTHQTVHFMFYLIDLPEVQTPTGFRWLPRQALNELAFPRTLKAFLDARLQ